MRLAEFFRLMRTLPLEEMEEVAQLLGSIQSLRFNLFIYYELPRAPVLDCSA